MTGLAALTAGLIFGAGLTLSGMVDPNQVLGFLNLAGLKTEGQWSPNLLVVMGAAVIVTSVGYAIAQRRGAPLFAVRFQLPTATRIDQELIYGAIAFGAGWGLVGFCPGPAIVSALLLDGHALAFLIAFAAGQWAVTALRLRSAVPDAVVVDG